MGYDTAAVKTILQQIKQSNGDGGNADIEIGYFEAMGLFLFYISLQPYLETIRISTYDFSNMLGRIFKEKAHDFPEIAKMAQAESPDERLTAAAYYATVFPGFQDRIQLLTFFRSAGSMLERGNWTLYRQQTMETNMLPRWRQKLDNTALEKALKILNVKPEEGLDARLEKALENLDARLKEALKLAMVVCEELRSVEP